MNLSIVIEPESTSNEKGCIYVIAILTFVPFIVGLILGHKLMLISMPIGLILIVIFNASNKGKFYHKNWIQTENLIFTKNTLRNELLGKEFIWNEMKELHILIKSFEGQSTVLTGDPSFRFTGLENTITFSYDEESFTFKFYIQLKEQKRRFITFLRDELAPYIKKGEVKIFLNSADRYRTYAIHSIEPEIEELVR